MKTQIILSVSESFRLSICLYCRAVCPQIRSIRNTIVIASMNDSNDFLVIVCVCTCNNCVTSKLKRFLG